MVDVDVGRTNQSTTEVKSAPARRQIKLLDLYDLVLLRRKSTPNSETAEYGGDKLNGQ